MIPAAAAVPPEYESVWTTSLRSIGAVIAVDNNWLVNFSACWPKLADLRSPPNNAVVATIFSNASFSSIPWILAACKPACIVSNCVLTLDNPALPNVCNPAVISSIPILYFTLNSFAFCVNTLISELVCPDTAWTIFIPRSSSPKALADSQAAPARATPKVKVIASITLVESAIALENILVAATSSLKPPKAAVTPAKVPGNTSNVIPTLSLLAINIHSLKKRNII